MQIPSFLEALLEKLLAVGNKALHAALQAIHNVNVTDVLQQAAEDAVKAAEANGGSGKDKFEAAVAAVQKDFTTVAIGTIHTAVQNAWAATIAGN